MKPTRKQLPWIALAAILLPATVLATVEPPVAIRWVGPPPSPAKPGQALQGQFEIVTGEPGVVENIVVEGAGWSVDVAPVPRRLIMTSHGARTVEFTATPLEAAQPLVVRCTYDGVEVREVFRLDAESLEREQRPRPIAFVEGAPTLVKRRGPKAQDQTIRFHGRFTYVRSDGQRLGADNLRIRIMDDDDFPASDEVIWEGTTNDQGWFDVTVDWDDCDVIGCDSPDIYIEAHASGAIVDVTPAGLIIPIPYFWTSAGNVIGDFDGDEIDFGIMEPTAAGQHGAVHVFNSIVRAHRYADVRGGMQASGVWVVWPNMTNGAAYNESLHRIVVGPDETWTEGTHAHEFGHHLSELFSVLNPPNYNNGFCDNPTASPPTFSHCVWCPETSGDAWQEGWANWFGSIVNRASFPNYGTLPLSRWDFRYTLDTLQTCSQDNVSYPNDSTEGFVGALLVDMDDVNQDDHGTADCDDDVMTIGDDEIFTVFREDDPTNVIDFINKFRLRYNEYDQDLWSTARNVAVDFTFPLPPPVVSSSPEDCQVVRAGETVRLVVTGNGSILKYQWRRNGVNVVNGAGVSGAQDSVLVLSPAVPSMSGTYNCLVSTCNATFSALSLPANVGVEGAVAARPIISWGENAIGQIGDGTNQGPNRLPARYNGLTDVIAADGGRAFTIALRGNGTVQSWGWEGWGELGNGGYGADQQFSPAPIPGLSDVVQISSGYYHSLALLRDGTVRGWGYNGYGILGDGTQDVRVSPVVATRLAGYCVRAIACGDYYSMALVDDGTVLAWGYNDYGSLGRGTIGGWSLDPMPVTGLHDIVAISAGSFHGLALRSDGTVWSWGFNNSGQLGHGTTTTTAVPAQVVGIAGIRSIAGGYFNSYAIGNDGTAYAWGTAGWGMIGDGDNTVSTRTTPVVVADLANALRIESAPGLWSMALMQDGTVRAWGYNYAWITGSPAGTYQLTPVPVPGVSAAASIGAGYATAHTFGTYTGVADAPGIESDLPKVMAVRVSPNPSVANATIAFDLPLPGRVSLSVYDVAGRRVRSLLDEAREAGRHSTTWDGRSPAGGRMVGVFYVRLELNGMTLTERVVRM